MLLSYLVTSRTRRELLRVLWADAAEGSVSEVARLARVSFAAAHRELEAMRAEGLALSARVGAMAAYRADRRHPQAALVRRLLEQGTGSRMPSQLHAQKVRRWLAAAGAPLMVSEAASAPMPGTEEVLAEGLRLSHDDAAVALVLPLALWRQWDHLDQARLVREAARRDELQSLGFFLELTGQLAGDPRHKALARGLRDRRRKRARPFFTGSHGRMAMAEARRKTPPVARRWGYLMNMGLDSFESTFAKHRGIP